MVKRVDASLELDCVNSHNPGFATYQWGDIGQVI